MEVSGSTFTADQVALLGKSAEVSGVFYGDIKVGTGERLVVEEIAGGKVDVSVADFAADPSVNTIEFGDLIAVTGDIGLAALGFNLTLMDNIYVKKALKPIARVNEGILIKRAGATAATDITDGLASELYTIKKEGFGFMIYENLLLNSPIYA